MRALSAFAGIGGFDLGFARAGIHVTDTIEWDEWCNRVLTQHFPNVNRHGDINVVAAQDLQLALDAFVGGFPCQDTSIAAPHRRGLAGTRSGNFYPFCDLIDAYLGIADQLHPEWVVIENPDGLLKSPKGNVGADFAAVREGLADLGYGVAWRVVDGGHLGSPQRRRRVLVVGHLGGDGRTAGAVLGLDPAGGLAAGPSLRSATPQGGPGVAAPVVWRKSARPTKSLALGGYETWVNDGRANTLTGFDGGLATRQTHLLPQGGRLRTLTPREWERLQGFPDDWTAQMPVSKRWEALGNAIHVGTAEWLGRRLVDVHTRLALTGSPV